MRLELITKYFHPRLISEYTDFKVLKEQYISFWCTAVHQKSGSPRLIKILNTSSEIYKQDPSYCFELFYREAVNATQSQNPNCLRVLDFDLGLQGASFFIAYPYLPSLRQLIDENAPINLASLLSDVKQALVYAKKEFGLTHGALSPESIFYDRSKDGFMVSDINFPVTQLDPTYNEFKRLSQHLIENKSSYTSPEIHLFSVRQDQNINVELIDVYSLALIVLESAGVDQKSVSHLKTLTDAPYNTYLRGLLADFQVFCQDASTINTVGSMLQDVNKRPTFDNFSELAKTARSDLNKDLEPKNKPIKQLATPEENLSSLRRNQSIEEKTNDKTETKEIVDLKKSRSNPPETTVSVTKKSKIKILEESSGSLPNSKVTEGQGKIAAYETPERYIPSAEQVSKGSREFDKNKSNLRATDVTAAIKYQDTKAISMQKVAPDDKKPVQKVVTASNISKNKIPEASKTTNTMSKSVIFKTGSGIKTIDVLATSLASNSLANNSSINLPNKGRDIIPEADNITTRLICESAQESYLAQIDFKTELSSKWLDWSHTVTGLRVIPESRILSVKGKNTLRLVDMENLKTVTAPTIKSTNFAMDISKSGQIGLVNGSDLVVYNLNLGAENYLQENSKMNIGTPYVYGIAWDSSSQQIACLTEKTLAVRDSCGELLKFAKIETDAAAANLRWSPDNRLLCYTQGHQLHFYDTSKMEKAREFLNQSESGKCKILDQIRSVEWGTEPFQYYVFGNDYIRMYDMKNTQKSVFDLAVKYSSYSWDAESSTLALGDPFGSVKLYEGKTLTEKAMNLKVFSGTINKICPLF